MAAVVSPNLGGGLNTGTVSSPTTDTTTSSSSTANNNVGTTSAAVLLTLNDVINGSKGILIIIIYNKWI